MVVSRTEHYSEWEEEGLCWKQEVSCSQSFRKDVTVVRSELDTLLRDRQARDTGICQVRIQSTGYRVQKTRYRIQSTEYRVQNTRYRVQSTWYRVQNTG